MEFVHNGLGQRVRFASAAAAEAVADEVASFGGARLMVIASESRRELAERLTGNLPVVLWHREVVEHVPATVAERARAAASSAAVDAVLCVGGGSTTGLAKAVVATGSPVSGLPILAVPTTYSGSEATNVWGMTTDGVKRTAIDDRVLPRSVVYDATLMLGLPLETSVASGLNAMAHCVDAMWGPRVDPVDQALAEEGIRGLAAGLRQVVADPSAVGGREQTLYGAYLAAAAFACAGSGLHHHICHVLGGMFNLPHAATHAVVLPHVLALNAPYAPDAARRIARAFAAPTAAEGLRGLRAELAAPTALRDYGMPEDGIERAVAPILASVPAHNPASVTEADVVGLLRAAWAGQEPG